MRAIVVMFDSLNRKYLPPYDPGCAIAAPNFERLAAHSVTFDNCYAGSLPCMPARRELHTGRYNFLHRSWGPMEPFDDSIPEMLGRSGVTTHLATDHMHYWEDGGATYHTRYGTYALIRGQQGDPWKGRVSDPEVPPDLRIRRSGTWRQDRINREYISGLAEYPQTLTFDAGLEFIADNKDENKWFVQIETFDPHEPFDVADEFLRIYGEAEPGVPGYDWPDYMQVLEDEAVQRKVRQYYSALVSQCDASLGRVIDAMDEYGLWQDTLLIVCTDHGFLLGEQGWWGKSVPPWYDETVHTPLFVWDPREAASAGTRSDALVQTIDIGPSLLDLFEVAPTADMEGRSLHEAIRSAADFRDYALFGAFGGHVSVTDGRYVYMRACADETNAPLFEHTLMPTQMRGFFPPRQMTTASLHPGFSFTKGMPVLRTDGGVFTNPYLFGTLLFDLERDPGQTTPLVDDAIERRMAEAMVRLMRSNEAPPSQFQRLGLPIEGEIIDSHLLCRRQQRAALAARERAPSEEEFPASPWSVRTPVRDLLAYPPAAEVLERYCRPVRVAPFGDVCGEMSLYRAASHMIGVLPWAMLRRVAAELAEL